jgi:hypothetical protein
MNSILFCFSEYKLHLRKAGYPVFINNASINTLFCCVHGESHTIPVIDGYWLVLDKIHIVEYVYCLL